MKLITTSEDWGGHPAGAILSVHKSSAPLSMREDIDVWVERGNRREDFPHPNLTIIDIPDEPVDLNLMDPSIEDLPNGGTRVRAKIAWRLDRFLIPAARWAEIAAPAAKVTITAAELVAWGRDIDGRSLPVSRSTDGNLVRRRAATVPLRLAGS